MWLASWEEATGRAHLCVRVSGMVAFGGLLTLQEPGVDGVAGPTPVVTSDDDISACALQPVDFNAPELRVYMSAVGANPASICVKAAGGAWTAVHLGTTGDPNVDPNVSMPVVWTPDPD